MNESDHNLLIRLDTKFDMLSADVKTMGDGLSVRVAKNEQDIESIKLYHASLPVDEYKDIAGWACGIRNNMKLILFLVTLIFPLIVAILSRVISNVFNF